MNNFEKIKQKDGGAFQEFIGAMDGLMSSSNDEREILSKGRAYLTKLISDESWLPEDCAKSYTDKYAQHLLYIDPLDKFSVVSFVWGPGQRTPIHDHTVWGLVGVLRGAELCNEYVLNGGAISTQDKSHVLNKGQVEAVSPTIGDWHQVENYLQDKPSISIHVYGGDIGNIKRHMLNESGKVVDFVSGYSTT
jgi:predicted metal-dependent enzyme (double-stranded beta helix superfamily)